MKKTESQSTSNEGSPTSLPEGTIVNQLSDPPGFIVKNGRGTRLASVTVAYHVGPPEITFYGRLWYRGAPQEIPEADWLAMQQRADFAPFEFRSE